ncbi:MAG: DUF349 domain-containing protein, partial [Alistipes sp.]|nr:DUF349 domain-containing protein [Alistipes sp.]
MSTENPALHAPEEHVDRKADDVSTAAPAVAGSSLSAAQMSAQTPEQPVEQPSAQPVEPTSAQISDQSARPRRPRIKTEAVDAPAFDDEQPETLPVIDFSDEDAALAARDAGLEIEGEGGEEFESSVPDSGEQFVGKDKEEVLAAFARLISEQPVQSIRREVEAFKIAFYRLRRAEVECARRAFVESGGAAEAFVVPVDDAETRFKELFREYRTRRDEFISSLEAEKEKNLQIKLGIIEELKELISSDETLNHTFTRFRELQSRWKETGLVPQACVKDLWETYNLHVENFYSFIKINKELRDLDLKKNYESKIALCEAAEALVLEPSVVEAFHKLQKLHDEWRETGPVANEFKETLWERFREASGRINRQHQEYFE